MESQVIIYPFSRASGQDIAHDTGYLFAEKFKKYFCGRFGVSPEIIISKATNEASENKNGINNFDNVKSAIEELCNNECIVHWSGKRPINIGGDHSQGFATVKSTLFVEVLKETLNGDLGSKLSVDEKAYIKEQADKGNFVELAKHFDTLVESGKIDAEKIREVTDKIHVVWLDAHADFNTVHISPSGNAHGMALAAATHISKETLLELYGLKDEKGVPALTKEQRDEIRGSDKLFGGLEDTLSKYVKASPKRIHILGTRDLDFVEEKLMEALGVDYKRFEMHNTENTKIRPQGKLATQNVQTLDKALKGLISNIKAVGHKFLVSFDIDILSVNETGTPIGATKAIRINRFDKSPVGPNKKDAFKAIENLAKDDSCLAFDLTEMSTRYKVGNIVKRGLMALATGLNILAYFCGGKEAKTKIAAEMKEDKVLKDLDKLLKTSPETVFGHQR